MSEDVRKRELAPLQSIRDNYEKPCCPLSLVLMLLTTASNPKTLSTGCLTNKHCIFKGNLKFFAVHVWNICELNTFGVANRHNWRFKASVHMSRCFSFAHIEEEWYICGAVQIQGQASKPHGGQQLCLFHRWHDLRQKSDWVIRYADDCRVFLCPHSIAGLPIHLYKSVVIPFRYLLNNRI